MFMASFGEHTLHPSSYGLGLQHARLIYRTWLHGFLGKEAPFPIEHLAGVLPNQTTKTYCMRRPRMLTFCVSLRGNCSKKMMSIFWRESLKDSFVLCVCVCVFVSFVKKSSFEFSVGISSMFGGFRC